MYLVYSVGHQLEWMLQYTVAAAFAAQHGWQLAARVRPSKRDGVR